MIYQEEQMSLFISFYVFGHGFISLCIGISLITAKLLRTVKGK